MPGVILAGSTGQALDVSLATILSEFRLLRDFSGVMRSTATKMTLQPHEGVSKHITNYGRVIAYNLSDGVDMAQAQDLSDARTSFTPGEVGVQVILGGRTITRVADPDLLRRTGRMLHNAYDLKEDQDGTVQMASFTTNLGSSTTVASPGFLMAANARLLVGNSTSAPEPAPDPLFCVIHPLSAVALAGRLGTYATTPAGGTTSGAAGGAHIQTNATIGMDAGGIQADVVAHGLKAIGTTLAGMTVKIDANIADDGTSATGGAFSKEAMIYVSELEPMLVEDTSDKSMRGAVELNLYGSYVWGLYRPANYGIALQFDASLPTS